MMLPSGWGRKKVSNNRSGIRKPKVRWEVLGLQSPLTISMEDIRQQVSHMANSWLEKGPRITQGKPPTINRRSRNNAGL
jgi:hypothetical protein